MTAALASALRDKGELPRAESILRAALAKSPRSLVAHSELARVLAAARKCPEAQAEVASLPPNNEAVAETRRAVAAACPTGAKR
jgi:thioredoxin-like negative regulator of GroEL